MDVVMNDLRKLDLEIAHTETAKTGLYAEYPVVNQAALRAWIKTAFPNKPQLEDNLHVTVCYSSKGDVDLKQILPKKGFILAGSLARKLTLLGESVVIKMAPGESRRFVDTWQMFRDAGASWDFPSYIPHLSIGYQWKVTQKQLDAIEAYPGSISFGAMTTEQLKDD